MSKPGVGLGFPTWKGPIQGRGRGQDRGPVQGTPPSEQTDRQIRVKTLPSRNFVSGWLKKQEKYNTCVSRICTYCGGAEYCLVLTITSCYFSQGREYSSPVLYSFATELVANKQALLKIWVFVSPPRFNCFLISMQFSGKICQSNWLAHPSLGLAPPCLSSGKSWIHICFPTKFSNH